MKFYVIYDKINNEYLKEEAHYRKPNSWTKNIQEAGLYRSRGVGTKIHHLKIANPVRDIIRIAVNRKIEIV